MALEACDAQLPQDVMEAHISVCKCQGNSKLWSLNFATLQSPLAIDSSDDEAVPLAEMKGEAGKSYVCTMSCLHLSCWTTVCMLWCVHAVYRLDSAVTMNPSPMCNICQRTKIHAVESWNMLIHERLVGCELFVF